VSGSPHSEHRQARDVHRTGQEPEVGLDAVGAADPGPPPAMAAAHQVPEFAFGLWAGGPVVGDPGRVGLPCSGIGECLLVGADADRAPGLGAAALRAQRAPCAGRPEVGDTAAVTAARGADRGGDPGRAGDGPRAEIDREAVLAE
jgi:hypothetical protein